MLFYELVIKDKKIWEVESLQYFFILQYYLIIHFIFFNHRILLPQQFCGPHGSSPECPRGVREQARQQTSQVQHQKVARRERSQREGRQQGQEQEPQGRTQTFLQVKVQTRLAVTMDSIRLLIWTLSYLTLFQDVSKYTFFFYGFYHYYIQYCFP